MALIGGEYSFYAVRVLLGIAEAGFFPGIIFYLTLWFPGVYRARIIGWFMAAIPLSSVLGAPVSGMILSSTGGLGGLAGWQWLFILEAAPAVVLSVVVWFYLTDRPADARWLEPEERAWLDRRLAAEARVKQDLHGLSILQALCNPKVLALSLVYFGAVATNYGTAFWLPQIIKGFGLSNLQTGFVAAIPYVIGTVGMIWWSRRSDAKMERKGHAAIAFAIAAIGIAGSTFVADPTLKMIALSFGAFGVFAVLPVFWTFPTAFLSGASAAAGIAAINSIGNLSGFFGPFVMGWLKDVTGDFSAGLLAIAGCAVVGLVVVLALPHDTKLEKAPAMGHAD
jgi:MFS family permease